ncbi:MAG: magnesium transporter [bacterium]
MPQIFDHEMDKNYIAIAESTNAGQAIKLLREAVSGEMIYYVYVVNDYGILRGVLSLRKLLVANLNTIIGTIMDMKITVINAQMTQEEVNAMFRKTKYLAIPVVDDAYRLMGTVTLKKTVDDIAVENADEVLKIQGVSINVFDISFITRLRVKLPWLITTVISGLICGYIMFYFEKTALTKILALAFFIPLITAMGESVGGQSSAIMIEGLILGKLKEKKVLDILFMQLLEGLVMAIVIGLVVGLVTIPWLKSPMIALLTGSTIFMTILIATFNGTLVPLILKKLNINPVASTNPLVFAITDITVLIMYFVAAIVLMRYFPQ